MPLLIRGEKNLNVKPQENKSPSGIKITSPIIGTAYRAPEPGAKNFIEIGKKINEDFDKKKLPLMLGMVNAIIEDKKLELDWQYFN